jgi:hypothetical protein
MIPNLAFLPWLVGLILCAPVLACVLYPLYAPYRHRPASIAAGAADQQSAALPAQRESEQAARSALTEVELDYQLGNLAEPDYRSLRERYLRRAFSAHKSIQAYEQELDELIEARLRQLREATEQEAEEEEEEAESQEDHENAE